MRIAAAAILTLAAQWLLGILLFLLLALLLRRARRRWRATWAASARISRRLVPAAAGLALIGTVLAAFSGPDLRSVLSGIWLQPLRLIILGACSAAACPVMLHAGHLEARGRLRRSRRQARLAGELIFAGAFAQLILLWTPLIFRPPFRRAMLVETHAAGVILLGAMLALVASAFVALTGGLAGKPRPSAHVAAFLYACGIVTLITAYRLTL